MIRALALAVLAALALPPAALAENATISIGGSPGQLTYAGSSLRDAVFMSRGNPPSLIFDRNGGDAALTAGSGCNDVFGTGVRIACTAVGTATIELNGGDDWFSGGSDGVGMTVNGGTGNDTIIAAGFAQRRLNGGAGADVFNLAGSANTDWVDGGDGDDTILYPRGSDDLHGGAGIDTVQFLTNTAVSVTLDDQANDGPANDVPINVHADVENVIGSDLDDALTGSAAANVLDGGKGNDSLDGGPGADVLRGGEGDDQIEAQDGVADKIECGLGNDRATVDVIDTVSGCETVVLPDEDHDGVAAPLDCDDHDPAIHPGATDIPGDGIDQDCSGADAALPVKADPVLVADPPAQVVDHDFDRDGVLAGADCVDTDPAIRPGAIDIPGDGIDQDCSGADAPYPRLTAKLSYAFAASGRNTLLTALELRELQDATVSVRCSGCSVRKTLARVSGTLKLTRAVKGRKLRPGTVITITVSRPGFVSEVRKLTMRARKKPKLTALCRAPGAAKPTAC